MGHVLQSPELRQTFLPQIHADFALSENYRFRDEQPLDCPIVAFAGVTEDDLEESELNAWSAHTGRGFRSRRFPGDHFFIRESQALVVEALGQEVASMRRAWTVGSQSLPV
jgi:surfactin synthase thioesterase subunit